MATSAIAIHSRHYQLPVASLTPFSLPQVGQAMRAMRAEEFSQEHATLVDFQGHSSFCIEALASGLIPASAMDWIENYPGAYGLYRMTEEAVEAMERKTRFAAKGLVKGIRALRKQIDTPYYDPSLAAGAAVACIEAQILDVEAVADLIASGPSCAHQLFKQVEQCLQRSVAIPEPYQPCFTHGIEGNNFILAANFFADFEMDLPTHNDFHEVRVMLFKTLDAMSRYLIPFHTPASFLGQDSYNNYMLADAYRELKDIIIVSGRNELVQYLIETPVEKFQFEIDFFTGGEGFDEDSADTFADRMLEMHEVTLTTDFSLGADPVLDMQVLREQARQQVDQSRYGKLLAVLIEALDICQDYVGRDIDLMTLEGTHQDGGVGFFENIVVVAGDFPALQDYVYNEVDDRVAEYGYPAVSLPVGGPQLANVTLPLIRRTNLCLDLLNRITITVGDADNDQQ